MNIIAENNNIKVKMEDFNPAHTFLCGQCFRWEQDDKGIWTGIVSGSCLRFSWKDGICTFFNVEKQEFLNKWSAYFDLDTDYGRIKEELSRKDEHLRRAVSFGNGIRLLRQDLWEVMLSFVISQNNGIPRIKQIIETLSLHFGRPLPGDSGRNGFPDIASLAGASLDTLNICRGGYRCRYISAAAKKLCDSPSLLDDLKRLPGEEARELLLSFPGIGGKVADCILLYSGIDRRAFPVDRWVKRVMEMLYFHSETDEKSIREFARDYFGDLAGIAQQYLFYYAREHRMGL